MGNCCDVNKKHNSPKINISVPQVIETQSESVIKEQSMKFKEEGNQYMQQKLFKEAIIAYTQAINLYNKESIYYSNRAVAYRTLSDYTNVKKDAMQALQLDNKNVRAYFVLGTVYLILGQQDKCLIQATDGVNFLIQAQKHIQLKPQLQECVDYNYSQGLILKSKLEQSENYKGIIFYIYFQNSQNQRRNQINSMAIKLIQVNYHIQEPKKIMFLLLQNVTHVLQPKI
ncbi:unnamed protein product [Paramecium primaurelia]|uniref:Tetratricopeptide repeat protein n=1 Tax=Paramecium primaurelia TaxID=5886 RepID=A0A8S1MKS2_PARPR|nr:unnamed protein product [Paramecium primaurelia]